MYISKFEEKNYRCFYSPIFSLWPCSLAIKSVLAGGFMVLWFYVQEHPKAVVLILKRLRTRGHCLKSHTTDCEKPGIEPATPGLQDIGLFPTPWWLLPIFSDKHGK